MKNQLLFVSGGFRVFTLVALFLAPLQVSADYKGGDPPSPGTSTGTSTGSCPCACSGSSCNASAGPGVASPSADPGRNWVSETAGNATEMVSVSTVQSNGGPTL